MQVEDDAICIRGYRYNKCPDIDEQCEYSAVHLYGFCGAECLKCHGDIVQFADGVWCRDCLDGKPRKGSL